MAKSLAAQKLLEIFELTVKNEPWAVAMMWSKLSDRDQANCWLRQRLQHLCQDIFKQ